MRYACTIAVKAKSFYKSRWPIEVPLDGTLIRRRLAPCRSWYSFYRLLKDGKLRKLQQKEVQTNVQSLTEPGFEPDFVIVREKSCHCTNHAAVTIILGAISI